MDAFVAELIGTMILVLLGDGVVAIEWAERWRGRPDDRVTVRIDDVGDEARRITVTPARRP